MKKIVILNGSPQDGRGGAHRGVHVRRAGDGQRGHVFFLNGMNIRGCLGCFGGGKDPASPCVQKDGMLRTCPAYRETGIVVPATPLCYWTIRAYKLGKSI